MTSEAVRFGMFDWIDESGRDLAQTYAERLRMVEVADALGFYAFHLAEHHATELSTVPSPNVFLSAVAQRTHRMRLGPLSYVLPMYDPIRLLEEICMLDQLSGGRLELGVSRGSVGEHIDNDPDKARGMFDEILNIVLMGLSTGEVDFHGRYFSIDAVATRLKPAQRPYPPLWYPTSNASSIPWIASQGMNTAFPVNLLSDFDKVAAMVQRYKLELAVHASDSGRLNGHIARPKVGMSLHIHVAETDALAMSQARPAYERFAHNFTARYVRRGEPGLFAEKRDFDREVELGRLAVGSPATVRELLGSYLERSGANYVIGCFSFGSLTLEQILTSVDLFATQVMPGLRGVQEVWEDSSCVSRSGFSGR